MRSRRTLPAVVALLALVAASGCGDARPTPKAVAPATTSTTDPFATNGDPIFATGQCLQWDVRQDIDPYDLHSVVPCAQAHLAEVTGTVTIPGANWPGNGAAAMPQGPCTAAATRALGASFDPAGRFLVDAITPDPDQWSSGNHTADCLIVQPPLAASTALDSEFTGRAKGASQARLLDVGACLASGSEPVPCTESHIVEVTGHMTLPASVMSRPATDQTWTDDTGACDQLAAAYFGGTVPASIGVGYIPIAATSWALGQRSVMCIVGRNGLGTSFTATPGPLRGGA